MVPLSSPIDEYGAEIKTWQPLFNTRASINPISGNEKFLDGLKNSVTHKIEVRFRKDFTYNPEDRIVYNGRYFDTQYILNWSENDVGLTLLVIEHLYKDG